MIEQVAGMIFALPGGRITALFVLFVLFGIAFYALYKALFFLLKKASERTKTGFDDLLSERLRDPARLFAALSSVFLALNFTYPEIAIGALGLSSAYAAALMLVCAFALDRFMSASLEWYKKEIAPKTGTKMGDEMIPIMEKVLRIAIYVLALLMVLGNLGIEITPLLAGLGIASLAVALALQDSLGNFFAGVNIAVDRPLKKDDFISTDSGVEGVVQEIGWRSTKILTSQNNYVIIPNTKLAQSIITNYCRPDEKVSQNGTIGVSCGEDVERVSQAIKNAIRKAMEKSDAFQKDFEPRVRFDSFGDFSLNFKFTYAVKNYALRHAALDEINRAIFYEFKEEGITIPFPTRTIYSLQSQAEKAEEKGKKRKYSEPKK